MRPGTTVAVMDWDSHRYLESYFGIPMMGATLFIVNVLRDAWRNSLALESLGIQRRVDMYWHNRQDLDPAHRWLRQTMVELFGA